MAYTCAPFDLSYLNCRRALIKAINNTVSTDVAYLMTTQDDSIRVDLLKNSHMNTIMRGLKEDAKRGIITLDIVNNDTHKIFDKQYYSFLIKVTNTPSSDKEECPMSKALCKPTHGVTFLFRRKDNRDAVFNYINKYTHKE